MAPVLDLAVRDLDDAREAAGRAAVLCPRALWVEMALLELLVNAVEHGNLAIGHADKARLREAGEWESEVARRLVMPEYAGRRARLTATHDGGGWCFEVSDEGAGFDWQPWLEMDAKRATAPSGRGIALARQLAFPDLAYLERGNRVRCRVPDR